MIRVLLLSLLLLAGCRTIQRAASSSNTAQTQAETTKFNREIVTEYVVRDTATEKPVIVNVIPPNGTTDRTPPVIVYPRGEIIRQTIRESGEEQKNNTESTQIKNETKEAGIPFICPDICYFRGNYYPFIADSSVQIVFTTAK